MNNQHCIYFHRKPDGTVFYVGQSISTKRPYTKLKRSLLWRRTVRKYGYTVEIVHTCLTKQQANDYEKHYIKLFGRRDIKTGLLVNRTDGADGGSNKLFSPSTRRRMSDAHKGERNVMFGKTHNPEARRKISIVQKGRRRTPEQIEIIRKVHTGRVKSPQEIEKLRQSKLGIPRPESVKLALSNFRSKPVIAIKDCAIMEFGSMFLISKHFRASKSTITKYILSEQEFKGFKLFYL